jgi:Ca2+-binding RTX toxin-like protein
MAYNETGTAGNDTLDHSADTGPGTIIGLAGDDLLLTGTAQATVSGDAGNDTVVLQAGNTGTVTGGTDNDSVTSNGTAIGSMMLFGNEGADTITTFSAPASSSQTIVGGNDSADGADSLTGGAGNDIIFGNGGNDTLDGWLGADTLIGGVGNDSIWHSFFVPTSDLVYGNEGNDTMWVSGGGGSDTVFGGSGDDSIFHNSAGTPSMYGNEGNDTINAFGATTATIIGGQDSADGSDSLTGSAGADLIFGNGGDDRINAGDGANTVVGGFGADSILAGIGADVIFGNESNDTISSSGAGADTVFAGLGDDTVITGDAADMISGNEGNDTIRGGDGIDTIAGGSGNDQFAYSDANDDGSNANGGGPVEFVSDVNWAEDKFQVFAAVTYAAVIGPGSALNLEDTADNALAAALALAGGGSQRVAAQFNFNGRTYLAIDQAGAFGAFTDDLDLLFDITGATGSVSASNFTT